MSADTSLQARQCPLCGQDNRCAIAQGLPPEQCWCMTAQIDQAALQRIPAQERGKRCICPACGQLTGSENENNDGMAATATTSRP